MIRLILNGKEIKYFGDGKTRLIDWLRGSQKIKSVKDGCSNEHICGACLVEIDKKPKLSCSVQMAKLNEADIVTLEGIPPETRSLLGKAFVALGGVQCGFCSPGMLMRTNYLLSKNNDPTREEVTKAIKPHLCRCTGYVKIVDAILLASKKIKSKGKIEYETQDIGNSSPKYQALERALGNPMFIDDLEVENVAFGSLCFSEHPRAKVVKIDTSKAEAVKGVLKVLTAKDIPGKRHIGMVVKDWPVYIAEGETTRYVGDVIACVIAESEYIARKAVSAIEVDYKVFEPLTDVESAMTNAIKLYENGNVLTEHIFRHGENVQKIFDASAYVVSDTFSTKAIEHAFLEVESCLCMYKGGRITIYSQSQGIYKDREQIAEILDLDKEKVNVILVPTGGAFGGKLDITVQSHAALGAFHLKRPVRLKLNRCESIRMHPKKHPTYMTYKLSCDEHGRFTGLYARIVGDTGAYASLGIPAMKKAAAHAGGAYHIPNVDVKSSVVYTNNPVAGAMRGFGTQQANFAIEGLIDELCEKGGFDKWEIRYNNALETNLTTSGGERLRKEVGLKQALKKIKKEYQNAEYAGIACAIKNIGIGTGIPEVSKVNLEVVENGKIRLYHGWSEMGQGIDTVLQQMLYEYVKPFKINEIEIVTATEFETQGGPTVASRGTFLGGNALLDATKKLKEDIKRHGGLKALEGNIYKGVYIYTKTKPKITGNTGALHISYGFAAQVVILSNTGKIKKIITAHDSGRVINKSLFEGQIHGSLIMGLGYALSENLKLDKGKILNGKLGKLGLLRSTDVPEIEIIPIEIDDTEGPFGAKGIGEIAIIPTAPAVASAYMAFDGEKRRILPLAPLKRNKKTLEDRS